jgi:hypothetical protein
MAARLVSAACLVFAVALAAACSSSGADDDAANGGAGGTAGSTGGADASSGSGGTSTGGADASGGSGGTSSGGAAGDLGAAGASAVTPYANVTAVMTSGNDGAYTFDVSIESADIDCSQFSDWWEVLGADETLIYRRILEHSHTDANGSSDADAPGNTFTRSGGPVSVSADDVVIVRAHMSVGGYNGRVMRGSVSAGFADALDIGSDFAASVESEDPQPTGCEF